MITVKYTCEACGLKDRDVIVPEREGDEDVVHYVRDVIGACVGEDHARTSPQCQAKTITNLKIPIDTTTPNARVGSPIPKKP